jgi:hypothetical protein
MHGLVLVVQGVRLKASVRSQKKDACSYLARQYATLSTCPGITHAGKMIPFITLSSKTKTRHALTPRSSQRALLKTLSSCIPLGSQA